MACRDSAGALLAGPFTRGSLDASTEAWPALALKRDSLSHRRASAEQSRGSALAALARHSLERQSAEISRPSSAGHAVRGDLGAQSAAELAGAAKVPQSAAAVLTGQLPGGQEEQVAVRLHPGLAVAAGRIWLKCFPVLLAGVLVLLACFNRHPPGLLPCRALHHLQQQSRLTKGASRCQRCLTFLRPAAQGLPPHRQASLLLCCCALLVTPTPLRQVQQAEQDYACYQAAASAGSKPDAQSVQRTQLSSSTLQGDQSVQGPSTPSEPVPGRPSQPSAEESGNTLAEAVSAARKALGIQQGQPDARKPPISLPLAEVRLPWSVCVMRLAFLLACLSINYTERPDS